MNHQSIAHETSTVTVELARKELADLFGVSVETIKRRTAEGYLKPASINSRVLRYGEDDIRSMIKMGYRLDGSAAQAHSIPAGVVGEKPLSQCTPEAAITSTFQEKEKELLKYLRQQAQDPALKAIMVRFLATLILQDDLN